MNRVVVWVASLPVLALCLTAYAAAIGTILGACVLLGRIAIGDWLTILIGLTALFVLFRWKVSNPLLITVLIRSQCTTITCGIHAHYTACSAVTHMIRKLRTQAVDDALSRWGHLRTVGIYRTAARVRR